MSSLNFLTHNQLHEVFFEFLDGKDILQYRAVHSACDAVVLGYARTQLQDVLGQDLCRATKVCPRSMDTALVSFLVKRGGGIGNTVNTSAGGVRSLSTRLFHGKNEVKAAKALETVIAQANEDWAHSLVYVDVRHIATKAYPLVTLVSRPGNSLVSLNVSRAHGERMIDGSIKDDSIKRVADNCPQLEFLDVSWNGTAISDESMKQVATKRLQLRSLDISHCLRCITDVSIKLLATNCIQLRTLNVGSTSGGITDESIKLVAANCLQLRSLDVSASNGKITDESMKAVAKNCRYLRSLNVSYNM